MHEEQGKANTGPPADNDNVIGQKRRWFQTKSFLFVSLIASISLVTLTNVIGSNYAKTNSNIFFIVLPAILSILAVRLAIKFPSQRLLLIGFVLFSVLSAIAEDLFIVYESVLNVNPFPSVADGLWLAGYLSLFAFFVAYLRPLKQFISKKVATLASVVSVGFLIPSIIQVLSLNSNADNLSLAVALAYPVIDAVILCPVIMSMAVLHNQKPDPFLFFMLIAILSFIVADSMYLVIYNSYENGNPIDIGWIIGYILFAYATVSYNKSGNRPASLAAGLDKKTAGIVSSEAVFQFVIPLLVISIVIIGSIYLADFYLKERVRDPSGNLAPVYMFLPVFAALLLIVFAINRNLMKIVRQRTQELEGERDVLRQQNEEKTKLINKSRSLEAKLQNSLEELQKTEQAKDEFIAMITHELKTPLVPIKGYSDLLLTEHLGTINDNQRERLSVIRSSSESLLRLINDLLDVQKIELGQLKMEKQKNNLTGIIQDTIDVIRPSTDLKGITVTRELDENVACLCDKERIKQVLHNLFSNSIDFVQEGSGRIDVMLKQQDKDALIVIRDNGIGIEKENLDKLFVKFYQIDTASTREHKGTGLGLSICKGIVSSHGGKIWASSEGLGKGAEFHIVLPIDGESG